MELYEDMRPRFLGPIDLLVHRYFCYMTKTHGHFEGMKNQLQHHIMEILIACEIVSV